MVARVALVETCDGVDARPLLANGAQDATRAVGARESAGVVVDAAAVCARALCEHCPLAHRGITGVDASRRRCAVFRHSTAPEAIIHSQHTVATNGLLIGTKTWACDAFLRAPLHKFIGLADVLLHTICWTRTVLLVILHAPLANALPRCRLVRHCWATFAVMLTRGALMGLVLAWDACMARYRASGILPPARYASLTFGLFRLVLIPTLGALHAIIYHRAVHEGLYVMPSSGAGLARPLTSIGTTKWIRPAPTRRARAARSLSALVLVSPRRTNEAHALSLMRIILARCAFQAYC